MQKYLLFLIILPLAIVAYRYTTSTSKSKPIKDYVAKPDATIVEDSILLQKNINAALAYAKAHNMNTGVQLISDLSLHSGLERFYVIQNGHIIKKGCVSHGCADKQWGKSTTAQNAIVSNTPDSHCSSEGHYRIGKRGVSEWGIKVNYLLHGLDKTNSNALQRAIVLHSWEKVPPKASYPDGVPEGWGCPALSNELMLFVDSILQNNKNVLLWCKR